jgi:ribokinase
MPRILVVGSINMDLVVTCDRVPAAGETVHGSSFLTVGGGKGANQAVAAARLGAKVSLVGRVGEDEFGRQLCAGLQNDNVDTRQVRSDPEAATGTAIILLDSTGENRIIILSGANGRVGEEEVAAARTLLHRSDAVLMQLETPIPVIAEVAQAARESGVLSILDAGPATHEAIEAGLPRYVDIISPNESEAAILTGIAVTDLATAAEAAHYLRKQGAPNVVMKLGSAGAYWLGEAGEAHVPGFPVTPVDTTAAGDSFTAGLAVALASGFAMDDAIRRANASGALACLHLGAQPSLPTVK